MDRPDWQRMRRELLRAGMAPRRAARLLRELADHYADLREAALRAGHSSWEADVLARAELGADEVILAAVRDRQELRAPASRWPWLVYGLAPVLMLMASVLAVVLMTALAVGNTGRLPATAEAWVGLVFGWVNWGLPVLIAALVLVNAALRRAPIGWPVAGTLLVIAVGAALTIDIRWPGGADAEGLLLVTYRWGTSELGLAMSMLLLLMPSYLLHRRLAP